MKNSIKTLITIAFSSTCLSLIAQQKESGIYLTAKDYEDHHLSYILGSGDKLQLNEFLNGRNINLSYQGKKVRLTKNDLFGYRLHGQDYRFFKNEGYTIIDTTGFTLYGKEKLTQKVKGYKPVECYFFSKKAAGPVLELTLANLESSFSEQVGFRYSLRSYFSSESDLIVYDRAIHQYKLKYLYYQQKQALTPHQNTGDK